MINSQLQSSSIKTLLQTNGIEYAQGRVRAEHFSEEMSLIGFVPCTKFYKYWTASFNVDLNGHLAVTPYLLRFSKESYPIPIFKKITQASGKKYNINENLIIESIIEILPENVLKQLTPPKGYILPLMNKIRNKDKEDLFEIENNTYNYIGKEDDFELYDGIGNLICISNDFLCLCTYINSVTGILNYIVLPSNDTVRVLSVSNNNEPINFFNE